MGNIFENDRIEALLIVVAENAGLIAESEEEAEFLNRIFESDEYLTEDRNIVKLNKASKLKNFEVRAAIGLAADKKDPLFAKYARAAKLKRTFRDQIMHKYSSQAAPLARKLLTSSQAKNLAPMIKTQMPSTQLSNDSKRGRG